LRGIRLREMRGDSIIYYGVKVCHIERGSRVVILIHSDKLKCAKTLRSINCASGVLLASEFA